VRAGDVVTAVNGTPIDDPNSFRNRISSTPPGTSMRLSILRDGKQQQVTVTLDELKADLVTPDQRSDR
jgi:serine protease Do